jgi:hypothetical protein
MAYFVAYDPRRSPQSYDSEIQKPPAGVSVIEVQTQEEMLKTIPPGWTVNDLLSPPVLVPSPPPSEAQLFA